MPNIIEDENWLKWWSLEGRGDVGGEIIMANIVKWKQSAALNIVGVRDCFLLLIYSVFISSLISCKNSYSCLFLFIAVLVRMLLQLFNSSSLSYRLANCLQKFESDQGRSWCWYGLVLLAVRVVTGRKLEDGSGQAELLPGPGYWSGWWQLTRPVAMVATVASHQWQSQASSSVTVILWSLSSFSPPSSPSPAVQLYTSSNV